MIIIYALLVVVASLVVFLLKPIIAPADKMRRMTGADYDEFQSTIENYSKAIEVEMGGGMAEFFKGSTNLMLGQNRKARGNFVRAKKLGKHISQHTLDLCG